MKVMLMTVLRRRRPGRNVGCNGASGNPERKGCSGKNQTTVRPIWGTASSNRAPLIAEETEPGRWWVSHWMCLLLSEAQTLSQTRYERYYYITTQKSCTHYSQLIYMVT
jgi:hypothetical protein